MDTKVFIPASVANFEQIVSEFANNESMRITDAIKLDGSDELQYGVVLTGPAWQFLNSLDVLKGIVVVISFAETPRGFHEGKYFQCSDNAPYRHLSVNEALKKLNTGKDKFSVVVDFQGEDEVALSACSLGHANADYWQKRIGEELRKIGLSPAFHHVWVK